MIGFPPLEPAEARRLLDSISTTTPAGLRDRVLIGLMVYTFVRIGASLAKVEDVYTERRLWVRPPGGVDIRLAAGGCCRMAILLQ